MFAYVIAFAAVAVVIVVLHLLNFAYECARQNKLLDRMKWCLSEDSRIALTRCGNMYTSIIMAQHKYIQNPKHRIIEAKSGLCDSSPETIIAKEILNDFYLYLCVNYFSDRITLPKFNDKRSDEEYFMSLLGPYLLDNQGTTSKMGDLLYEFKEVDSEGKHVYTLTDYGIVFYKLSLIVCSYCGSKERSIRILSHDPSESIADSISTGEVAFYRYRY